MATIGVLLGVGLGIGQAHAKEGLALGLIVKLKDSRPSSVVQLKAVTKPHESAAALRSRLGDVATRQRVSFVKQRQTAFGAQLIRHARLTSVADAELEAKRLRQDPEVEWVVVNEVEQPQAIATNDPGLSAQHWITEGAIDGYPNVTGGFDRLTSVMALTGRPLKPIVVAVLDTGVLRHPDLDGTVLPGYDFVSEVDFTNEPAGSANGIDPDPTDPGDYLDDATRNANPVLYANCKAHRSSWHGTSVAGVLAMVSNNAVGGVGMLSPFGQAALLPVRVSGVCGAAVSDIIEGALWAAGIDYNGSPSVNPNPARVINLSFGGSDNCQCAAGKGVACLYQEVAKALAAKGAVLVASAGNGDNEGSDGYATAARPANCPGVLAVTALNERGAKAYYANLVTPTGVATIGGESNGLYTTSNPGNTVASLDGAGLPTDDYTNLESGTSFSAPIVSGTIALMWSVNPGLTVAQILEGLRVSSRPFPATGDQVCTASNRGACRCTTATCGAGVVDVDRAILWASNMPYVATPASTPYALSFTPERLGGTLSSPARGASGGGGGIDLPTLAGLVMLAFLAAVSRVRGQRQRVQ